MRLHEMPLEMVLPPIATVTLRTAEAVVIRDALLRLVVVGQDRYLLLNKLLNDLPFSSVSFLLVTFKILLPDVAPAAYGALEQALAPNGHGLIGVLHGKLRYLVSLLMMAKQVMLPQVALVTQLALELLQHRLRVILRDVASQRVFCQSPVEALSALVLEELKSKI